MNKNFFVSALIGGFISKGVGMDIPPPTPLEGVFQDTPKVGSLILSASDISLRDVFCTSKLFHPTLLHMLSKPEDKKLEDLFFFSRLPSCADFLKQSTFALDVFYDSSEKELTDRQVGKIVESFPNLSSLRLNIIYLSEKGLRQLMQLTHLKTLILECSYTDALKSMRWQAGEDFRLKYYPERLKFCREVMDELKQEVETWDNEEHKKVIIGDREGCLKAFKKAKKELRFWNKVDDSHAGRLKDCLEIIKWLNLEKRKIDDQDRALFESILLEASKKVQLVAEGRENQDPFEAFMQEFSVQLAGYKVSNPYKCYQSHKKYVQKKLEINQLLDEEERQERQFATREEVDAYVRELSAKVLQIEYDLNGREMDIEDPRNLLLTYKCMLPSLVDWAYNKIEEQLLSCNFPSQFRRERWGKPKEDFMKDQDSWLMALPHDNCSSYLEDVIESCQEKWGEDFWQGKINLEKKYWEKVLQSLKATYPGVYLPEQMKREFPLPSGVGVYQLAYSTLFFLFRDREVQKNATLDFAYVTAGHKEYDHELDDYAHFYEIVQDPQTLESYDKLWEQLKLSSDRYSSRGLKKKHEGPYQTRFTSCSEFRKARANKQQKVLASCVYDIVRANSGLKHLKIPSLEGGQPFGGVFTYPTHWSMELMPGNSLGSSSELLDLMRSREGGNDYQSRCMDGLKSFEIYGKRRKTDEKTFRFILTKLYTPNYGKNYVKEEDSSVLPFIKKLDVLEFTHPYVIERLLPPVKEAQSSLTICIPQDKLMDYVNFMEGIIEQTEYIGKLIFNRTFEIKDQIYRKKHGLELFQTKIPQGFMAVIETLKSQGRIGSYEILTVDESALAKVEGRKFWF